MVKLHVLLVEFYPFPPDFFTSSGTTQPPISRSAQSGALRLNGGVFRCLRRAIPVVALQFLDHPISGAPSLFSPSLSMFRDAFFV